MTTVRNETPADAAAIHAVNTACLPTDGEARFGSRPATAFGLSDEYGGGPAFQAVELIPGALPVGAGLVRYAAEFAVVG